MAPELKLITALARCDQSLMVFAATLAAWCASGHRPRRRPLGPIWTTSSSPDGFGYLSGQVLDLADGRAVAMMINLSFEEEYVGTSCEVHVSPIGEHTGADELIIYRPEQYRSRDVDAIAEATLADVAAICRHEHLLEDLGVPQSPVRPRSPILNPPPPPSDPR